MKTKKTVLIAAVAAVVCGVSGYFIGTGVSKHSHREQISEIRKAWYESAIAEEKFCAELYAKCVLLDETPDNPTFASIWGLGILLGTSHALESMNQVAIAFGENPILLSDINTTEQRIENIAKSMIQNGEISNN